MNSRKQRKLIALKRGTQTVSDMEGLNKILSELKEAREKVKDRIAPIIG